MVCRGTTGFVRVHDAIHLYAANIAARAALCGAMLSTAAGGKARENDRGGLKQPRCEHDADIEYTACLVYSKGTRIKMPALANPAICHAQLLWERRRFSSRFQVCGGTVGVMK